MTFDTILALLGLMRIGQHLDLLTAQVKRDNDLRSHLIEQQAERFAKWRLSDSERRENFKKQHLAVCRRELSDGIKAVHEALKVHFADQMTEVLRAAKVPTKIVEEALARWRRTA